MCDQYLLIKGPYFRSRLDHLKYYRGEDTRQGALIQQHIAFSLFYDSVDEDHGGLNYYLSGLGDLSNEGH